VSARVLVAAIADLRRHPGARRRFTEVVVLSGLGISTARVPDGAAIEVDLELETLSKGLVATGTITVPWEGDCRRCLTPVTGSAITRVKEIFEPRPVEGETYPMGDDLVDLEPMVRDAVLLALPLAPLCGEDCRGPAPGLFPARVADEYASGADLDPEPRPVDPRWAALDELHFDSGPDGG